MYAVIKTGGKQYRVAKNDVIKVERSTARPAAEIEFAEVLMVGGESAAVGAPLVAGASVTATVLEQAKGDQDHRLQEAAAARTIGAATAIASS